VKHDREFQHESLQDRRSIVAYLEAVAEGIRTGRLRFSDHEGEILLEPEGLMNFDIRVSKRRERVSLSLHCRWKQQSDADDVTENGAGPLSIDGDGSTM